MREFFKSQKLKDVLYDIRGPVLDEAKRMEEEGYRILKLNTGNPAVFGLCTPDEIVHDIIINLTEAEAYCDSKGLFSARKAIMQYYQSKGILDLGLEDIYIGNGVSELIQISMQALLDNGDEILVPIPDYPLWTASVFLSGGKTVHYLCDEQSDWVPDLKDIESKITEKTKGIVVINPNNPTGAVYPKEILEKIADIAEKHDLIIFSDEIYEKIVYDNIKSYSMCTITDKVLVVTYNGLSKAYRAAGFRTGWMILTGKKDHAKDYIEGVNMLTNMRLCSNVPTQFGIQTALGGYQSIEKLIMPGGRLYEQREISYKMLNDIPGLTCVKPKGALYCFPKMDVKKFNIKSDEKFAFDFLREKRILVTHGTGFNWHQPDHFRLIFLPEIEELEDALNKLKEFFAGYHQED